MRNRFVFGLLLVLFLVGVIATPPSAYADRTLFTVSIPNNGGPNLRVANPLNGATIATIPITLTGFSVLGSTGLARDPTTGKLWGLLRVSGATSCSSGGNIPQLVTINPGTGVATNVGSAGDCFSGLAFSSNGTLYGVTGDGANTPATLYTLNKSTAAPTLAKALGNGDFGEAIGFNPTDGLIYHASGFGVGDQVFESINPANLAAAPVNIPRSGFDYTEALGMTHSHGNTMLLTDGGCPLTPCPGLLTITTSGVATSLGVMDHDAKGLAFTPKPAADFDRDIKNDIGIYRNGAWSIIRSSDGGLTNFGWGGASWQPVAADYDGDAIVDIAVYNASGLWSIVRSSDGGNTLIGWSGAAGDIPVPADYDGDGKADLAVYNSVSAGWSIIRSSDGGLTYKAWGGPSWMPVMADYDGDGKVDIAVYNANGLWSIVRSSDGANILIGWSGAANDIPVPADYDGDGKADLAVYNTATAGWSIIRSSDGGLTYKVWGGPAWEPVPADYDGDGKADIAVYNASNGVWSIVRSLDGGNTLVGLGGGAQDIPLN